MDAGIAQVMSRIQSIEAKIDSLSGDASAPQATGAAGAGSFESMLGSAQAGQSGLDPAGEPVRPLGVGNYASDITEAAQKYGVDPTLIKAVMQVESGGDPRAVSKAGAMGLMQLMPSDAAEAGVTNPFDPAQNIDAGTRQLSSLLSRFGGNLDLALAGYNAGPNAVKRFGGVPPYPETQSYIHKIHSILEGP